METHKSVSNLNSHEMHTFIVHIRVFVYVCIHVYLDAAVRVASRTQL